RDFDEFMSIDEVSETLDHSLEIEMNFNRLEPEIEFWGHCSNLQAWSENFYDTSLLHSNLAFPLLKKLTDVGDPKASQVFKDEIAERLMNIHTNVAQYLIRENYLEYFNKEETELLMEILFEQIEKKFKKKQSLNLEDIEIETLLQLLKANMMHTQTFLINQLKPNDNINKETLMGFSCAYKKIRTLGFNRCGLRILPPSIGNLEKLENLYLTENRLSNLPTSIGNLKNLQVLELGDNHLNELPIEIGNLRNLKELNLDHNVIQYLPETISKLEKLEILSIWGNQLRNLPKNMNEMHLLRVLGLSFNQLDNFPKLAAEFPNLEILDLSNNKLESIPENIHYLKSLKTLWLNNNPIKNVSESISTLRNLTDLYLVNTPIAIGRDFDTIDLLNSLEASGVNVWV
ncbi:MAG: leucine-rich repeat domain-containing protein, partial [Promethearchaeota archaeon]